MNAIYYKSYVCMYICVCIVNTGLIDYDYSIFRVDLSGLEQTENVVYLIKTLKHRHEYLIVISLKTELNYRHRQRKQNLSLDFLIAKLKQVGSFKMFLLYNNKWQKENKQRIEEYKQHGLKIRGFWLYHGLFLCYLKAVSK